MDGAIARILIESLVQRLSRDGGYFHLPDGRLSENEVTAICALADVPKPQLPEETQAAKVAPTLNLAAFVPPKFL